MKRLLFLSSVPPLSGATGYALRTSAVLRWLSSRFQVDVLYQASDDDTAASSVPLSVLGSVDAVEDRRGPAEFAAAVLGKLPYHDSLACNPPFRRALAEKLSRVRYDLIWVNKTSHLSLLKEMAPSAPLIMDQIATETSVWDNLVENDPRWWAKPFFRWNRRKVMAANHGYYGMIRGVVCITSQDLAETRRAFPRVQAVLAPMGFDPEQYEPSPPRLDRRTLVFSGTDAVRNQEAVRIFCEKAWPRVRSKIPDARLLWVGNARRERLRFRLPEGVEMTGRVASILPFLAEGDVFVAPFTMGEGMKAKIIEAMALGKVIVATPMGVRGVPVEGLPFVRMCEDWDAFGRAVVEFLRREDLADLCARSREHALAHYTWEKVLAPLEPFLAKCAPNLEFRGQASHA